MPLIEGTPWCDRHNRPIDYELKHSGLPCIKPETDPLLGPRLQCGKCPDQGYRTTVDGVEVHDESVQMFKLYGSPLERNLAYEKHKREGRQK